MSRLFMIAVAAGASFALAALTQAGEETESGIVCEVSGYDVTLYNRGDAPIPAETVVHW